MSAERSQRRSILVLGGGELERELVISARRLGMRVVAADREEDTPAMRVADVREVLSLRDGTALKGVVRTYQPDLVVLATGEVEVGTLRQLEEDGTQVVPSAEVGELLRTPGSLRAMVEEELGLRIPRSARASSEEELHEACERVGYPCVVKFTFPASVKGRSLVSGSARVSRAWAFAREESPGDDPQLVVEEFVDFYAEVTLFTLRLRDGSTRSLEPIAFREEQGERREAWVPSGLPESQVAEAGEMARILTNRLGGSGLFAVDFFVTKEEIVFSEVSAGLHETGILTLISQDLSEFDLYLRAILGLPIPALRSYGPAAAAMILSDREGGTVGTQGVERALQVETVQLFICERGRGDPGRKLGWALASGGTTEEARARALEAASRVPVDYGA